MATMKFTLEIELGNDGMRTGYQVANALYRIAELFSHRHDDLPKAQGVVRVGRDNLYRTVGKWTVQP